MIIIKDYKINITCKNGHIINGINFNEFENTQIIDISKIKCEECQEKDKSNTYNNEFYYCLMCKKNICPLCKIKHNNHKRISHDDLN